MTDKTQEALKLALEALQEVYWSSRSAKHDEAITALREALAEQPAQQEPVSVTYKEVTDTMNALYKGNSKQVQIAKEMENKKLYTSPPASKPWVCLTDEEVLGLFGKFSAMTGKGWLALYRITEAKLKEKNNG